MALTALMGIFVVFNLISTYNQLVTLNEQIDAQWAQVENQYQRRADLIPNLVNTVEGFAEQEREIFTNIAEARTRIGGAQNRADRMEAESELSGYLSRLLMISENYPQLRSNENFMALQSQLEGTENRIAVERRRYNEQVRAYNTYIKQFPTRMVASFLGFEPQTFYEADEGADQVPEVNFDRGGEDTAPSMEPTPATP